MQIKKALHPIKTLILPVIKQMSGSEEAVIADVIHVLKLHLVKGINEDGPDNIFRVSYYNIKMYRKIISR